MKQNRDCTWGSTGLSIGGVRAGWTPLMLKDSDLGGKLGSEILLATLWGMAGELCRLSLDRSSTYKPKKEGNSVDRSQFIYQEGFSVVICTAIFVFLWLILRAKIPHFCSALIICKKLAFSILLKIRANTSGNNNKSAEYPSHYLSYFNWLRSQGLLSVYLGLTGMSCWLVTKPWGQAGRQFAR